MPGIIDADTHISESEAMWAMMDKEMYPRRPVLLKSPEDTLYGPRNAFWLIDGNIFPKPNGKGSFRLITPSASKLESSRGDIHLAYREMTDIPGRLKDMDKLGVDKQVVFPTLFLIYITDDVTLDVAMARAYNRFLAQACAKSGGRISWVVVPPLHSVEESVKEIKWGKDNGAVGVFFRGIEGQRTLDNPYFNPIYQAASDTDLPILIHTGAGCPLFLNLFDVERNHTFGHSRVQPLFAFRDLIANKIPEQFPKLKIRLYRSLGGLGAVHDAYHKKAVPREVEIFFRPGHVPRVPNFRRLRSGRGRELHRSIYR